MRLQSFLILFLVVSSEAISVKNRIEDGKNQQHQRVRRRRGEKKRLTMEQSLDHEKAKVTAKERTKFVFIALVSVSILCTVGFTIWKHQYQKWNLKAEQEGREEYENVLAEYTVEVRDMVFKMKQMMVTAFKLKDEHVIELDEKISNEAQRLMLVDGDEEIHLADSVEDDAGSFTTSREALARAEEVSYVKSTMAVTKTIVMESIAISTLSNAAEAITDIGFDVSGSVMGGAFLIFKIVTNVMALKSLSSQLARAKLNKKFAASNARSEGQKVKHHARWAVCKIVSDLFNSIEAASGGPSADVDTSEQGQSVKSLALEFKTLLQEFWSEKKCTEFIAHEFVKDDVVEFKDGNEDIQKVKILKVREDSTYDVELTGDTISDETRSHFEMFQSDIVVPKNAGVVPPIRGNGLVVNMGISSDCYESPQAYKGVGKVPDKRGYKTWKTLCTQTFNGVSHDKVCELNKNPSLKASKVDEMIEKVHCDNWKGDCASDEVRQAPMIVTVSPENIEDYRKETENVKKKQACIKKMEECLKQKVQSAKNARKGFSRFICESEKASELPKHWNGMEKSRVIVYHQLNPEEEEQTGTKALYKLDLHQMYVSKKGDWASVMALSLLGIPGWLRPETDPIKSTLLPNWLRHFYRAAKRRVQPNPNLDAMALTRGIDFETAHYLAPRWSLVDVQVENSRKRCGKEPSYLPSNFDRRWLSTCTGTPDSMEFMDNEFRDTFVSAVQRGREKEETSSHGYVPTVDHAENLGNKDLLFFWRRGENAPAFLKGFDGGTHESLFHLLHHSLTHSLTHTVDGPCTLRGYVKYNKRFGSGVYKYKKEADGTVRPMCEVVLTYVPDTCGSVGADNIQEINKDLVPESLFLEKTDLFRFVEAARVAESIWCFKPLKKGLQEDGFCKSHWLSKKMLLRISSSDESGVGGEGDKIFMASQKHYDEKSGVITLSVEDKSKCDSWEDNKPNECIAEDLVSDAADSTSEYSSSSDIQAECAEKQKAWKAECSTKKKRKVKTTVTKTFTKSEMYLAALMVGKFFLPMLESKVRERRSISLHYAHIHTNKHIHTHTHTQCRSPSR